MASISTPPSLTIGGATEDHNAPVGSLSTLATIYQNLLSGAAQIFTATGAKILVIDAGAIGIASTAQIGLYPLYHSEATETAQEVAANFSTLKAIAAYCRANGISVQVDAVLSNPAVYGDGTNALVDQWASVAAAVGLPITAVEDVNELGIVSGATPTVFANEASIEVNAVKTLISQYAISSYHMTAGNLAVGDMEAGDSNSVPEIAEWWAAYSTAAAHAGLSGFSFVSAELGWDAPWLSIQAGNGWQQYLTAISKLANTDNMALNVLVQGMQTNTTGSAFVLQQEQHAAQLASFTGSTGINVASILLRTWQPLPVGVDLITMRDSMTNSAAEIAATYPLYATGSITAQGPVSISSPGQTIINTGSTTPLASLSLKWTQTDITSGYKLAVVVITQAGTLAAVQHGLATVSSPESNILVLNGGSADLAAELSSITLNELNSGPDTVDIEVFGASGRVSDRQINVLALAKGQSSTNIEASNTQQGWVSSSARLNTGTVAGTGSVLASETLFWNTTGTLAAATSGQATSQPAFVKIDPVHEPLDEYGVHNVSIDVNGTLVSAVSDYFDPTVDNPYSASGGFANIQSNQIQWGSNMTMVDPFNPADQLTSFIVQSTVKQFDINCGQLLQITDILAANTLSTVSFYGTAVANAFATAFAQGGSVVTEFNTGRNTAWQSSWGGNFNSATLTYDSAGKLTEEFLQGGSSHPLYSLDSVYNPTSGLLWEQFQTVPPPTGYTNSATGPLYITEFNTGDNPNWDYLDWGDKISADTEIVSSYLITDNFPGVAFAGVNQNFAFQGGTIHGADGASANLVGSMDVINLGQSDQVSVTGNNNIILGGVTEAITQSGTGYVDTVGAGGTISNLTSKASFVVNGSGINVTAAAGDSITNNGSANIFTYLNGGTLGEVGTGTSDTFYGSRVTAWLNNVGQGINVIGSGNTITTNGGAHITVLGNSNLVGAGIGSTISVTGAAEAIYGSALIVKVNANTSATINGSGGSIAVSGTDVAVSASNQTVNAYPASFFCLTGNSNQIYLTASSEVMVGSGSKMGFFAGSVDKLSVTGSTVAQTVVGFNPTRGDRLDLTQILGGTSVSMPTLGRYIRATANGLDTTLTITGRYGSDSVLLSHAGAYGLQSLINDNAFILPPFKTGVHENRVPWVPYPQRRPTAFRQRKNLRLVSFNDMIQNIIELRQDLDHHFSRIRQHLADRPDTLTDHELLEMFLHFALDGADTRLIARSLLEEFKTFGRMVSAPTKELSAILGQNSQGSTILKLVHAATVNVLRQKLVESPILSCWDQFTDYISVSLQHERVERFHVLYLDTRNGLIADEVQSLGTVNHAPVYPREIVRRALELHASGLILVHNHPSGDPEPSRQDLLMTQEIQRAAAIMGISLHDHVIVGRFGCRSFRQAGLLCATGS